MQETSRYEFDLWVGKISLEEGTAADPIFFGGSMSQLGGQQSMGSQKSFLDMTEAARTVNLSFV